MTDDEFDRMLLSQHCKRKILEPREGFVESWELDGVWDETDEAFRARVAKETDEAFRARVAKETEGGDE
jgi:hypothetical protein